MLSYVTSSHSMRQFPLHILNLEDNQILTTIPTHDSEPIFLTIGQEFVLTHQSHTNLYQFHVVLSGNRTIAEKNFYVFEFLFVEHLENIRSEERESVSFPASFMHKNSRYTRLGHIVDKSKSGMKLETLQPIKEKEIHLAFEDGDSKHHRMAEIVWSNQCGKYYYYGLKVLETV